MMLVATVAGCSTDAPSREAQQFEVVFRTVAENERPLPGAAVSVNQKALGVTNEQGRLAVRIPGAEGQTLQVGIECPKGYALAQPASPLKLTRLRALGGSAAEPSVHSSTCVKQAREVAVVVRAGKGPGIPVLVNGVERAITDPNGYAHAVMQVDRNASSLRVDLDTSASPELLPRSPSRAFELSRQDAILVIDQSFTKAAAPARPRSAPAPRRHIPQRLN
jgi:hypothetical protein